MKPIHKKIIVLRANFVRKLVSQTRVAGYFRYSDGEQTTTQKESVAYFKEVRKLHGLNYNIPRLKYIVKHASDHKLNKGYWAVAKNIYSGTSPKSGNFFGIKASLIETYIGRLNGSSPEIRQKAKFSFIQLPTTIVRDTQVVQV